MKPAGKRRWWLWAMAALGLAWALVYIFRPAPVSVDTARVSRGPLRVTIDEDGEIRAHDRYVITATITGRLLRVALREGDSVRAGQVVAVLVPLPMTPGESAEQQARVEAAEASYREAQARACHAQIDLAQARRERERGQAMFDIGAISKQSLERLRATVTSSVNDFEAARAREESAAAEVRAARANLKPLETGLPVQIRAPSDAVLLRVDEKSERVTPAGTPIMPLADPSRYEVVVDVLSVPIGALFRCGERWCVFAVNQGRAMQGIVDIGQRNADAAQVVQGLRDGDTVVACPPSTLSNDARVQPR